MQITPITNRRHFLQESACGLGTIALANLLRVDEASGAGNPYAVRTTHHRPTAKNVIFLFMAGGPSQIDLFTPKPKMRELHGQPVPASFLQGLDDVLIKGSARVFASPRTFHKSGQCGMEFSDYLPHLATCANQLCMVRSMTTDTSNHHPGQLLMNCGIPTFGLPSMGSWATYGLGCESRNMPAFIVLLSRYNSGDLGGQALWDNAFLPAPYRGVTLRTEGDPILHLASPKSFNPTRQQQRLDAIHAMNQFRRQQQADPEIDARIAAYELAFRMQTAAPEITDIAGESQHTLDAYGIGKKLSDQFGKNCLLARRMVERGVRFVQLYHFTWDDHSNLNQNLKTNCERTEQGVAALIHDLDERGLLDETLVVWAGEFGRTPMNEVRRGINPGYEGRDHHPFGFTVLMAGGGIKRGHVVGATDELGYHAVEDPFDVHDLQATILHCLGLDHLRLTYRHKGRDFRLTDVGGKVMTKVLT